MVMRKIIEIDEQKCTGCGDCIPNCHEGALQIIDKKARLVSDLFCDGLGACVGNCSFDAMEIIEREAEDYDEVRVMRENIVPKGEATIVAHLSHLKDHGATDYYYQALEYLDDNGIEVDLECLEKEEKLACGCSGCEVKKLEVNDSVVKNNVRQPSALRQWPVQLKLLPPNAPFLNGTHLLVAADCVPFAHSNFHSDLLHEKSVVMGCPKLDDLAFYEEKLTKIFKLNNIKSVTVAIMEVPCCSSMYNIVESAVEASGKDIPIEKVVVGRSGEVY